jgi:hypothetical protein
MLPSKARRRRQSPVSFVQFDRIAEIDEIRLRAILVQPLDDGFVELARMVNVRLLPPSSIG